MRSKLENNAEQAGEVIAQWAPDLAIIDVILPTMNGVDFAIALKTQLPMCRVLLFSGQAATVDLLADALEKGHTFDILPKPVHPTEMLDVAMKMLSMGKAERTPAGVSSHQSKTDS